MIPSSDNGSPVRKNETTSLYIKLSEKHSANFYADLLIGWVAQSQTAHLKDYNNHVKINDNLNLSMGEEIFIETTDTTDL